jgi:hypothetical protein
MLFVAAVKLIKCRWTMLVAASHILNSIFSAVVGISLISKPDLLNDAFVTRFAGILNINQPALDGYIHTGFTVITVLIILGTVIDIITTIVKTFKGSRYAYIDITRAAA